MGAKKTGLFLVAGALVLFVLLYFAPKIAPKSNSSNTESGLTEAATESATLDLFLSMATKGLDSEQKKIFDAYLAEKAFDSLSNFWAKNKRPDLSSYYSEEKAKNSHLEEDWFEAGNRYYYAVQFTQDKSEVPVLYQSSIRCFKKGLALNPKNIDAQIMLASCYVDGSAEPMKGISMLREIEKSDSNNVKLQITFAAFSIKSGQLDKAIKRFNKVLEIDSTYIEAYLHLADAYEQMNDKEKTVSMLEKYAARTNDITAKLEINKYIKQLQETN